MIDLSKLAQMPYKHYLISKALSIAVEEMEKRGDQNEMREVVLMQNLIDVEYPQFQAAKASTKADAVDILTQHMELVDIDQNGVKQFRFRDEDLH